jgi:pimeloyl-ACP methyl ester carboxylesterase
VTVASGSGLHRLSYLEWGDPANPRVVVCVHGLTRCARDFDPLATALAERYRVVCPDMPGRGESGWLANPMEYATPTYVNDAVTLVARLGVEAVDWVGTSMGGLIGMALAALEGNPIRRMVLNEAGPVVAAAALERIGTYVGKAPEFPSLDAAEQYIRAISAPFGPHSDAEWRFLTEHVVRRKPDGGLRVHYDPAIAVPFDAAAPHKDLELWSFWERIRCPTLVIRGEVSDLLTRETVERMRTSGPRAQAVEIAGVGHAPTLMQPDQIAIVRDFLLAA